MIEKDYGLLRPFDLDAAKRGEKICERDGSHLEFIADAGPDGDYAVRCKLGNIYGKQASSMRLAPLLWVEDKPVYLGDDLYVNNDRPYCTDYNKGDQVKVAALSMNGNIQTSCGYYLRHSDLTWTPPSVKREGWINVYSIDGEEGSIAARTSSVAYKTKEEANLVSKTIRPNRIACIRIEWEEPAEQKGGA